MEFTCNFGFFWKKPSIPHIKKLGYDAGLSSQRNKVPLSSQGCRGCPQIFADQLTLSQARGADYAHQIILEPPDFKNEQRTEIVTKTLVAIKSHESIYYYKVCTKTRNKSVT